MSNAERVFELLRTVPEGRVVTYGQLAAAAGIRSPRAVGRILHHNPDEGLNPCHRVVFADGSLSPAFAFGGTEEHRARLAAEGVAFKGSKVDLRAHQFEFLRV
ncbi:MAG: Bifunctional transcriptional activator/DNA repair enzyme Ada [candidate division WS6 bacterium OLB20]|uniref:Bifunctional transcriptional activator/DNA repair enzyme Ada n=1 Tax=candidate division WS6 bacterium OLB20 TaxID=1617426 RepID=A0A136M045_9BACT|nr:MAG: Bifunctional transcriptional activator/DNA repair enzyme Ada [candidate division WS6 bacterium OLB20]